MRRARAHCPACRVSVAAQPSEGSHAHHDHRPRRRHGGPRRPGVSPMPPRRCRCATSSSSATTGPATRTSSTRRPSTTRPAQRDPRQGEADRGDRGRPDGEVLLRQHPRAGRRGPRPVRRRRVHVADGRLVYFSRPSFADVVALDLKSHRIVWRRHVDGYRADHMALSPDGRRLLVSASTAQRGRRNWTPGPGDHPHVPVGRLRRTRTTTRATAGRSSTPASAACTPPTTTRRWIGHSAESSKGRRVFEVVDARTFAVRRPSTWARSSRRPVIRT